MLELCQPDAVAALKLVNSCNQLDMIKYAKHVIPSNAEIKLVLKRAESGPHVAQALVSEIDYDRRPYVLRALALLVKLGVLRAITPNP